MAKIYYDPDNDELIPISKSKSTRPTVSSADADDISERLERIESELQSLNRKTDEASFKGDYESSFSDGYNAGYSHTSGSASDAAAFALGAYAGWKLVDGVCDSVKDVFDTGNKCGYGIKKRWF